MHLRDTIISLLCVLVAIAALTSASMRLDLINKTREEMKLVSNTALENAPPSLAFATVAMGAFRGLVVDVLWIRAEKLKEDGQFFDAKQLADWITTLQPRFEQVWDFQAWNMAYNISVAMPASQWQERWKWVRNGYELLRDKGIKHNPNSIDLYRSLAWIFQHKIAGVTDDCHKHYKREIALSMRQLLYPMTNEHFRMLQESPRDLDTILADPDVAAFVDRLIEADRTFQNRQDLVDNYLSLMQQNDKPEQAVIDVLKEFAETKPETIRKFDVFARANKLRNDWSFEIDRMIEINQAYGPRDYDDPNIYQPLNWEHPNAHAIYWAAKGLDIAGEQGKYSVKEKNTDRIIFHALQDMYRLGRIIIYPVPDREPSVFLRPDLRMYDVAADAWKAAIAKYQALEKSNPKGVTGGYKNYMINAVAMFYQVGQKKKAGEIYLELRQRYPLEEFNVPLLTFVKKRMREDMRDIDYKNATEMILMSLREAYFRFAVYDDDEAFGNESWAKEIYNIYVPLFADEAEAGIKRLDLPSFEMLRYLALRGFLEDPFYPERMRNNLRARIANERPDLLEKLESQEGEYLDRIEQFKQEQQENK